MSFFSLFIAAGNSWHHAPYPALVLFASTLHKLSQSSCPKCLSCGLIALMRASTFTTIFAMSGFGWKCNWLVHTCIRRQYETFHANQNVKWCKRTRMVHSASHHAVCTCSKHTVDPLSLPISRQWKHVNSSPQKVQEQHRADCHRRCPTSCPSWTHWKNQSQLS